MWRPSHVLLALGEFTGGGRIAVESPVREVTLVDTRFGFAKVDGRFPHWVTPYRGERFSRFTRRRGLRCRWRGRSSTGGR